MRKLNIIATLFLCVTFSTQASMVIHKTDNVYFKGKLVDVQNGQPIYTYWCFTGFPNDVSINHTQNYLALGRWTGSFRLTNSAIKLCQSSINNNARNHK